MTTLADISKFHEILPHQLMTFTTNINQVFIIRFFFMCAMTSIYLDTEARKIILAALVWVCTRLNWSRQTCLLSIIYKKHNSVIKTARGNLCGYRFEKSTM